ncbi:MAG: radical SAM protein [Chloroflexales bacterium]|nr:radical SAM protein [Chloroflexales bacterium]
MSIQSINLYNHTLPELEALLKGWGQPGYRARQLYRQLYVNYANDAVQMSDLPQALRERIVAEAPIGGLKLVRVQRADDGLTRKALFALPDGAVVESVLMIYPDRATVCVSTQAGCAMGCVFCATGKMGLLRNLSTGEIVEQVLWAARELKAQSAERGPQSAERPTRSDDNWWAPEDTRFAAGTRHAALGALPSRLTNVVFMGMGEPFANYDRWWGSVERLHDPQGFNMGARSLTVSTVGLVPGILRLAEERLPINLAVSLHAPDDKLRGDMMPINKRYPIAQLLQATRTYITRTNRRVSFEYVLLQGRNDGPQQALMLSGLLHGMLCHVNLIPWNPVPGMPLERSVRQRVGQFQQILRDHRVACTVREERGIEIAAACGQLAGSVVPQAAPIALV